MKSQELNPSILNSQLSTLNLKQQLKAGMEECRQFTLSLFEGMDYGTFCYQAHSDFSPVGWHLGHIAYTEYLWLLEHLAGFPPQSLEYRQLFAADGLPKCDRVHLPTLPEVQTYLATVRTQVFDYLEVAPLDEQERLWRWLLQHESQHCETIAIVLELIKGCEAQGTRCEKEELSLVIGFDVSFDVRSSDFGVSASGVSLSRTAQSNAEAHSKSAQPNSAQPNSAQPNGHWSFDQDKGQRTKDKEPLAIQNPKSVRTSVSSVEPLTHRKPKIQNPYPLTLQIPAGTFKMGSEAIAALDNERPAHEVDLEAYVIDRCPVTCQQYHQFMQAGGYQNSEWWSPEGWQWLQVHPVDQPLYWKEGDESSQQPVCGVNWYEADAYARFGGKRLPKEAEWEKATHWNPDSMLGQVWEWTDSWFAPYPGFTAYPYRGYSQVYFDGQHRVLRGGSWATRPWALRPTFRNWYHPQVREIFAGFRCVSRV